MPNGRPFLVTLRKNLSAIEARLGAELESAADTHDVVLVMSAVNRVDTTAMEVLTDIGQQCLRGSWPA